MTKAEKAAYDKVYYAIPKNRARKRRNAAAWFKRTYDPAKAAVERKKKAPQHAEYCRQPWYVKYKKNYDRRRRLAVFGPFAEAYEVLQLLIAEIRRQMPDRFERYQSTGRKQWDPETQQRRRRKLHGSTNRSQFEKLSLGNA